VKSLLSLRDPDDKVVRAILTFGCSITFIEIPFPVSSKRRKKSWNGYCLPRFSI